MNVIKANVGAPILKDEMCGIALNGKWIGYRSPIGLLPGDQVALDLHSGQPLAIWRPDHGLIWRYEPEPSAASLTCALTPEQYEQFIQLFGMQP